MCDMGERQQRCIVELQPAPGINEFSAQATLRDRDQALDFLSIVI